MQYVKEEIKLMLTQDTGGSPRIQLLSLTDLINKLVKGDMLQIQLFLLNVQQDIQEIYAQSVKSQIQLSIKK